MFLYLKVQLEVLLSLQLVSALQINLIGLKINFIAKLVLRKRLSSMLEKTLVNLVLKNIFGISSTKNASYNVQTITTMKETRKSVWKSVQQFKENSTMKVMIAAMINAQKKRESNLIQLPWNVRTFAKKEKNMS